jgi:hypothetical protein
VPHKHIVFDKDAFTDKGMAGNLAVFTDFGAFLYFHKCADLGVVADVTTIEIDEVIDFDIFAEFDVGSYFFHI